MSDLKIFYGLLVAVQHHQTTSYIVLENCVIDWFYIEVQTVDCLCLLEATKSILVLFQVIETYAHAHIGMSSGRPFNRVQHCQQFFSSVVERKSNLISTSRLKYLCSVKVIVKFGQRRFRFGVGLGLAVVCKSLLVHSFAKVDVWSLKVDLGLGADEEFVVEVGRVENFVENYGKFCVYSELFGTADHFAYIRFLCRLGRLRFVSHQRVFVLFLGVSGSSSLGFLLTE